MKPFVVIGLVVALVALSGLFWVTRPARTIEYVREVTGIPIPSDVSDVDRHDDGERRVVLHVSLDKATARQWAGRPPFSAVNGVDAPKLVDGERLTAANRPPASWKPKMPLSVARGGDDQNCWTGILDPTTGDFWVEVYYPDPSGDPPFCVGDDGLRKILSGEQ